MQRYATTPQAYPRLRSAEERAKDFAEIFDTFAVEKAAEQSERCLQCGVPFCSNACPLGNHIPDWLRLTAEGRLREAYEVAQSTNTFPEICGRVCPQDRLCEGACVVEQADFGTITIGSVEKFVVEEAFDQGWVEPFAPRAENGRSVGIVGSGPGGLAAAEQLRMAGFAVHVYDRHDRVGGLLTYGIPNFKLDKQVVARRRSQYEASGVVFHTGTEIGRELSFGDLRQRHDALVIATGVYRPRRLKAEGDHLPGIVRALDFLIGSNRRGLGDVVDAPHAEGKRVVVIGGGDTAMDCVRTAIRQGAASVTCLYRRDRDNMPGSKREVKYAEEEGVRYEWLALPHGFDGEDSVRQVRVRKMALTDPDASGRRAVVALEGGEITIDADLVVEALGFEPEDIPALFDEPNLLVRENGTLEVDRDLMTGVNDVYAVGDVVRGASLVVWAIADGRRAAQSIIARWAAEQAA